MISKKKIFDIQKEPKTIYVEQEIFNPVDNNIDFIKLKNELKNELESEKIKNKDLNTELEKNNNIIDNVINILKNKNNIYSSNLKNITKSIIYDYLYNDNNSPYKKINDMKNNEDLFNDILNNNGNYELYYKNIFYIINIKLGYEELNNITDNINYNDYNSRKILNDNLHVFLNYKISKENGNYYLQILNTINYQIYIINNINNYSNYFNLYNLYILYTENINDDTQVNIIINKYIEELNNFYKDINKNIIYENGNNKIDVNNILYDDDELIIIFYNNYKYEHEIDYRLINIITAYLLKYDNIMKGGDNLFNNKYILDKYTFNKIYDLYIILYLIFIYIDRNKIDLYKTYLENLVNINKDNINIEYVKKIFIEYNLLYFYQETNILDEILIDKYFENSGIMSNDLIIKYYKDNNIKQNFIYNINNNKKIQALINNNNIPKAPVLINNNNIPKAPALINIPKAPALINNNIPKALEINNNKKIPELNNKINNLNNVTNPMNNILNEIKNKNYNLKKVEINNNEVKKKVEIKPKSHKELLIEEINKRKLQLNKKKQKSESESD